MKIEIRPFMGTATDYHEFYHYDNDNFMKLGFKMNCHEFGFSSKEQAYLAIVWPEGSEDELFQYIFTNKDVWEVLTTLDYDYEQRQ